jgi:hypothetical protein
MPLSKIVAFTKKIIVLKQIRNGAVEKLIKYVSMFSRPFVGGGLC